MFNVLYEFNNKDDSSNKNIFHLKDSNFTNDELNENEKIPSIWSDRILLPSIPPNSTSNDKMLYKAFDFSQVDDLTRIYHGNNSLKTKVFR